MDFSLDGLPHFCFFGLDGKSQYHKHQLYSNITEGVKYIDEGLAALGVPPPSLYVKGMMDEFPPLDDIKAWDDLRGELLQVEKLLHLDNVVYFPVDLGDVPPGYAEVDVLIDDRTQECKSVMVAGLVGSNISSSGLKRNT
jgi:hypothetical protein